MHQTEKNPENKAVNPQKTVSLLERLAPLAHQINSLDVQRIANVCIKNFPDLFGVRFVSLYILDETNNMLHMLKCNHPFLLNKIASLNQNPPSPMVMAVKTKKIITVDNIDLHKKPVIRKSQRPFAGNYKTKNCIIAPLICQDRVVGVLNLADKINGDFDSQDIALTELFSQFIGASLDNIKLFEKIQRQASTDGLTGFVNYKTFYETLEKELWRSRRHGGQISLIMVDIDNLKKINDFCGHRAGDKVIKEVSKKIGECIRQIDTPARYGGDEFAIILPNTSITEAIVVAERLVEEVSKSPMNWKNKEIKVSISVGLGVYNSEDSPEDITGRSDQALYIAKQSGKNTIKVFEPVSK